MTNRTRLLYLSVMTLGVMASVGPATAQAATAPATMLVSATVLSFCTIVALPLAFGNYSQALLAAASSVTVTCTLGTTFNVGLDVGVGANATVASRKMTFGTNLLNYGLFSDSGHSTVWGPTIGTNTVALTATGLPQILPVYGQIPASQSVGPGAYLDTVTATVTY